MICIVAVLSSNNQTMSMFTDGTQSDKARSNAKPDTLGLCLPCSLVFFDSITEVKTLLDGVVPLPVAPEELLPKGLICPQ